MFTIPIDLPSGKRVRIQELKNKHYFCILKFCTNADIEGLSNYFKYILFEEFKIRKDISYIDIIYILIYIRMVFIDSKIYLNNTSGKEISIGLDTILNKLEELEQFKNVSYTFDTFEIELGLPGEIYFEHVDDVIISAIQSVTINNTNKIIFSDINQSEKNSILNVLPASVYNTMISHVNNLNKKLGSVLLVDSNEIFDIERIEVKVFSNQLMEFLKGIYMQDLKNFFELMYHYNNKVIHDATMFMELSPVDSNIILNFFKKEVEDKNKELKNNQ